MLPESLLSVANKARDLIYFGAFSVVERLIKTACLDAVNSCWSVD